MGSRFSYEKPIPGMQSMTMMNPDVKQRLTHTIGYFTGGLAFTGVAVRLLKNSAFPYLHPWMLLFTSFGLLIGTQMVNYHENPVLKHLLYFGFVGSMGLSMVPLISMAGMPLVYDALFATAFTMAGLGLIAFNAPNE